MINEWNWRKFQIKPNTSHLSALVKKRSHSRCRLFFYVFSLSAKATRKAKYISERIWSQSKTFLPIREPDWPVHCGALYSSGSCRLLSVACDRNWFGVGYFVFLGALWKKFKPLECAHMKQEIRHQQIHNKWKEGKELEGKKLKGKGEWATFTGFFSGWAECKSFSFSPVSCVMKNSKESSEEKNTKQQIHVFFTH